MGGSFDEKAGVRVEAADRRDRSSQRVRDLARAAVGSVMNVCPSEIEIQSDAGIPTLHRADQRLPLDLSMSHDGRFIACAWAETGAFTG
jgi:phosphopantetheinyl transferase